MTYHFKMIEENNFKFICSLATRVVGLPMGSLSSKSRKKKVQVARAAASYIGLTEENIHRNIIAKELKRDRAITYHYEKLHKKNFQTCSIYRESFIKIYREYKNRHGEKHIFTDKTIMKNHLLKNGVIESKISDVKIEVKSGQSICYINTSYVDYTNQLKNIEISMLNYHYSLKIIWNTY